MNAHNRETLEHALGKIIIEVAELQGMRKADTEHVKAMLSRQTDRGRLAYAHSQSEVPRRFVFVGTSNSDKYLVDETGNRRFWPVNVKVFKLAKLKKDLDQLWGEAAFREALGESDPDEPGALRGGGRRTRRPAGGERRSLHRYDAGLPWQHDRAHHVRRRLGDLGRRSGRRTPDMNRRFGAAMKAIGWTRKTLRIELGRTGARLPGYGIGEDTRRIMVTRIDRNLFVEHEGAGRDGVSDADPGDTQAEADFG